LPADHIIAAFLACFICRKSLFLKEPLCLTPAKGAIEHSYTAI